MVALPLVGGNVVELGVNAEIFFDGQIEIAGERLGNHADGAAHRIGILARRRVRQSGPRPAVIGMSVVIMRISVDLPAPFGPSKPKISSSFTLKETSSTAVNSPYFLTI